MNSLRNLAGKLSWLAGWIDPDISGYMKNSDHWWTLQVLLEKQALVTYRQRGGSAGSYRSILAAAEPPGSRAVSRRQGSVGGVNAIC